MSPLLRPAGAGRHPPVADERGSTSIQMVMLMPALFAIMFLGLQGALYYYASNVAGAAAHEGASAASAYQNRESQGVGPRAASDALEQSHGSLQDWEVAMTTTADTVTVTVTGHPLSVLPGLELRVARSATLPWERVS